MQLLANEKDFRKWAIAEGFSPGLGLTKKQALEIGLEWHEKKEEQQAWFSANAPMHYPCLGYSVVVSYGMEESRPAYLYTEDLHDFMERMKNIKRSA